MHSKVIHGSQLSNAVNQTSKEINDLAYSLKDRSMVFNLDDAVIVSESLLSSFVSMKMLPGDLHGILRSIIKEACRNAETFSYGSSLVTLPLVGYFIRELQKQQIRVKTADENQIKASFSLLKSELFKATNVCAKDDFAQIMRSLFKESQLADLAIDALELAGLEGRVFLEQSKSLETSIELTTGHTFKLEPDIIFYDQYERWKHENVKCLLIDGIIENVHEAHNIFNASNEHNEPMIIVARGFGDEVRSTLMTNHMRGTLKIIPIKVGESLESVNVLKDIAVTLNSDVVSSLKGDLINAIKYEDIPYASSVVCKKGTVTITPGFVSPSIEPHIAELREQRQNCVPDLIEILDSRIRSLSSRSVKISLGAQTSRKNAINTETLDGTLRAARSILRYGWIEPRSVLEGILEGDTSIYAPLREALMHMAESYGEGVTIPALSMHIGIKHALNAVMIINSIGCAVVAD